MDKLSADVQNNVSETDPLLTAGGSGVVLDNRNVSINKDAPSVGL